MTAINMGIFNEIANNKADRDLRNVDLTKTDIVIEYQEPTEENNYTWYRLYASGWVEQGGFVRKASFDTNNYKVTLPIPMDNINFTITMSHLDSSFNSFELMCIDRSITDITLGMTGSNWQGAGWQVSGKADMTGHEVLPSKKEIDENDHRVVVFQKPTAENNYTWYRKYADGWVEMGGSAGTITTVDSNNNYITLPVTMLDTNYTATMTLYNTNNKNIFNTADVCPDFICGKTTTQIQIHSDLWTGLMNWRVEGLYATE